MKNATITQNGNMVFLNFFNTTEVFSIKGFDTVRKASNYAKKWGYTLFDRLPNGVSEFDNCN